MCSRSRRIRKKGKLKSLSDPAIHFKSRVERKKSECRYDSWQAAVAVGISKSAQPLI